MEKEISPETKPSVKPQKKDYFEIRIPRITFRDTTINSYLVFTLIIFAFLLGMLTHRVLFLQNTLKTYATSAKPTVTAAANEPAEPEPPAVVSIDAGKLPLLGNENAKVTVVEFSDFQCPYCEKFFTDTFSQLKTDYIDSGKIKFAFRHFPLPFHQNSQKAHEASECANEQGKFWDYHDLLFQNQASWSEQTDTDVIDSFVSYAGQAGLDTAQFRSCLESSKYASRIQDDLSAGQKVQVDGTPAFFINGHRLTGSQPFSEFKKVIDEQLKK